MKQLPTVSHYIFVRYLTNLYGNDWSLTFDLLFLPFWHLRIPLCTAAGVAILAAEAVSYTVFVLDWYGWFVNCIDFSMAYSKLAEYFVLQCSTYCPLSTMFLMPVMLMPSLRLDKPVPLSYFLARHEMFCLSASLSLVACWYQKQFRDSYCRNPGCQHLRASASPLACHVISLPLSPLLVLPFLQYCPLHGPQTSGVLQHFLGADQGSSWSPTSFCWMLSPHRGCGSLNRLSYPNDPTDLHVLPQFCPSTTCTSRGCSGGSTVLREGTYWHQCPKSCRSMNRGKLIPSRELRGTWGTFKSLQVLQCESLSGEQPL